MDNLQGIPFFPVEFNKAGNQFKPAQSQELLAHLSANPAADVFVLCHGWNNDMADARSLYEGLAKKMKEADAAKLAKSVFVGVYWPSKKFTEASLIPGGAASFEIAGMEKYLQHYESALQDDIDDFAAGTTSAKPIDNLRKLLGRVDESPKDKNDFVSLLLSTVPKDTVGDVDASEQIASQDGGDLLERLANDPDEEASSGGGAAGGVGDEDDGPGNDVGEAASIAEFFGSLKNGVQNLLNVTTYYAMKERAGVVGKVGVAPMLSAIRQQNNATRINLIGHSFGCRVVAAAASFSGVKVNSIVMLEAAFSHYGIAKNYLGEGKDGMFRAMVTTGTSGPIVITHTRNDKAVGLAYALASRIAGQVASAIGDKDDKYGGLGSNGAQFTPESVQQVLSPGSTAFTFNPGVVYNMRSDAVIGGHSDLIHPEVGALIMSAAK